MVTHSGCSACSYELYGEAQWIARVDYWLSRAAGKVGTNVQYIYCVCMAILYIRVSRAAADLWQEPEPELELLPASTKGGGSAALHRTHTARSQASHDKLDALVTGEKESGRRRYRLPYGLSHSFVEGRHKCTVHILCLYGDTVHSFWGTTCMEDLDVVFRTVGERTAQ
jgi:hypothetical protein